MEERTTCLLLLFLLVMSTSACPTSVTWEDEHQLVARAKILVLDLGLFVFDVVSDLINGVNFVNGGDPVWGSVIIGATFLPATFLFAMGAVVWFVYRADGCCQRLLFLPLLPLLGPVAIAVATPVYIFYVVFVLIRKLKDPSYVSSHMDSFIDISQLSGKSRFAQPADLLKVFEAVLEANIQGIIVLYVLLNNGVSKKPDNPLLPNRRSHRQLLVCVQVLRGMAPVHCLQPG